MYRLQGSEPVMTRRNARIFLLERPSHIGGKRLVILPSTRVFHCDFLYWVFCSVTHCGRLEGVLAEAAVSRPAMSSDHSLMHVCESHRLWSHAWNIRRAGYRVTRPEGQNVHALHSAQCKDLRMSGVGGLWRCMLPGPDRNRTKAHRVRMHGELAT